MSYQLSTQFPPRKIFLNSAHATTSGTDGYYSWSLKEPITAPSGHVFLFSVTDATIPYSFYIINTNNNSYAMAGVSATVTPGNYTILELLTTLRENHPTITFTYKQTTNKVTVTNATPFSMSNTVGKEPFLRLLGFTKDSYSGASSYTSESVVNLASYSSIYVFSNVSAANLDSYESRSGNIMCKIPVTSCPNGLIFFENINMLRHVVTHNTISEVRIRLIDPYYFDLLLNGVPFSMTIQIDIVPQTQAPTENPVIPISN